jgi:hypothetical protein
MPGLQRDEFFAPDSAVSRPDFVGRDDTIAAPRSAFIANAIPLFVIHPPRHVEVIAYT